MIFVARVTVSDRLLAIAQLPFNGDSSAEASSRFTNSNNNMIKDGCYYKTVKAIATLKKEMIKMRRIIGTRVNGRMLTLYGLTFPFGSVTTLAIDCKSRTSLYFLCDRAL